MLKESRKYRFYRFLYLKLKTILRQLYKDYHHCDTKCGNCNEWASVVDIEYENAVALTDYGYISTCGKCHYNTYWNTVIAPVAIQCDTSGTPLQYN